ncbi:MULTISPECIES: hypothetical protein [Bacillus cereus group]|jgi:hypothetical protein|uniref:hypothetical protein n=1 Tax=Bacillus cereus group TaxID=86661 RepID=UPI00080F6E61|nr:MULTISPECIES: hypothetical protein [Bacillus cereus group]ANV74491.1 hypothetical protein BCM43_29085 [Bacillus thuringiensis]MCU7756650.1 hypothetical protein [Bacillus cereus]MDC7752706.1 hypothetical protein [Bacillus cereus]PEW16203.1 hypothetical protein CN440_02030 [Bacillus cereus]PFD39038.1 hypothetical protein CN281_30440 [Bacillus cereus]
MLDTIYTPLILGIVFLLLYFTGKREDKMILFLSFIFLIDVVSRAIEQSGLKGTKIDAFWKVLHIILTFILCVLVFRDFQKSWKKRKEAKRKQ